MTKLKVAILLCDYSPRITPKFGNFAEQSSTLLKKAGLSLDIETYDAQKSCFPSDDQLNDIKAIWITGSEADSFKNTQWILDLMEFIKMTRERHPDVAFVGICFGHQIISRALGAKVGRNPKGWELGSYEVQVAEDSEIRDFFGASCFRTMEIHQDIVYDAIPGVKSIGSTKNTEYQGWYKKGDLLTFQGHPEFQEPIMEEFFEILNDSLSEDVSKYGKESLKKGNDGLQLGKLIVKFIESA